MGKKYCAVNTKYYKENNTGEIDHVLRKMIKNVNAIDDLTQRNFGFSFGDGDLKQNYKEKLKQAKQANKKAFKSNSNTFIDSVLIFNAQRFNECLRNGQQEEIEQATKDFMNDFKDRFGFEPIGFEFHLDEGTLLTDDEFNRLNEEEKKEFESTSDSLGTNYIKQNIHAHAIFLNFDFKQNVTCLRKMKRTNDWSESQDMLYSHFKKFGFERGEKKLTNAVDHKNKQDYVRDLALKTTELVENHSKNLIEQERLVDEIIGHQKELQKELQKFENISVYVEEIKKYFDAFSEKNPKLMNKFMKLPGFKAIKLKALYLYDVLRFKDTDIDQDPDQDPQAPDEVIEQKIEQKNEQESLEDLIKKNEEKEKIIEDKKQKIRLNNNKRKFRKRKPKP